MVKQGDIVRLDFDTVKGHEQSGNRPAVVVSNAKYLKRTNLILVCPISNTVNGFPMHVALNGKTKTTGAIKCEQVKAIDPLARSIKVIEALPQELLNEVVDIVIGSVEIV
jgi:mRNA interferase MazF